MKKIFIILLLFGCSKSNQTTGHQSFDITITGLNSQTYHWSDYSDIRPDLKYSVNGSYSFESPNPVCFYTGPYSNVSYWTFTFQHFTTPLKANLVSFGMPNTSGTFVNRNASNSYTPNIITIDYNNFVLDSVAVTIGNGSFKMTAKYDSALITVTGSYTNLIYQD